MNQPQLALIKPSFKLFDNQIQNVSKLVRRRRALLTDHVGAGKSMSILYAFAYIKEKNKALSNLLVLTPLSAYEKEVWKKDIQKFTNLKCIDIEELSKKVGNDINRLQLFLKEYDVVYGKHTHAKTLSLLIKQIVLLDGTMMCVDEIHAFKNPKSELTIQFRDCITSSVDGRMVYAKNFWGITGTSLSKNLEDTYNIINLISPWYLGSFVQFRQDYCLVKEQVVGRRNGRLVKVQNIVGIKNEELFKSKVDPLVITGESFSNLKFHWVDYDLSINEASLYQKIANGVDLADDLSNEDWIKYLLGQDDEVVQEHKIKDVERHSSRFIYLQSATDGVLTANGTQDNCYSSKIDKLMELLKQITDKKQTALVYFDFYSSLEAVEKRVAQELPHVGLLKSTGEKVLSDSDFTEAMCQVKPYIVLCTKASSESASYYWCNHVIFFHIPTVASTFIQFSGRITRKNTKFPDDLNCWIFRSGTIDMYKMLVVSCKTAQMEVMQGEEKNVPPDYKKLYSRADLLQRQKKLLLWNRY